MLEEVLWACLIISVRTPFFFVGMKMPEYPKELCKKIRHGVKYSDPFLVWIQVWVHRFHHTRRPKYPINHDHILFIYVCIQEYEYLGPHMGLQFGAGTITQTGINYWSPLVIRVWVRVQYSHDMNPTCFHPTFLQLACSFA